jgi:hypothetical protein
MCIGTASTCRPNPSRSPTGSAALPMAATVVAGRPGCTHAVAGRTGARPEWYWVIVPVRQPSAHRLSALHAVQGAGKGNLRSNDASTYGRCARRRRGSASSVKGCRTVTVTLYNFREFLYESLPEDAVANGGELIER